MTLVSRSANRRKYSSSFSGWSSGASASTSCSGGEHLGAVVEVGRHAVLEPEQKPQARIRRGPGSASSGTKRIATVSYVLE